MVPNHQHKSRTTRCLSLLTGACLAFLSTSTICFADRGSARPNVVILFTDDQGTLDANCFGSSDLHTPNIDALAARGIRFTQAYAHTVCCPSRAALLTGRHPQRGGVRHWTQGNMNGPKGINMFLEEVTLAETLKEAGYRTALFGKWHLGAHRDYGPKKQGFDEFFGIRDGFIDNYNHFFLHRNGFHDLYEGTDRVEADGKYFPEMMTDRAVEFIDRNQHQPFFLYVPFNIPHYPEQSLAMHQERYRGIKDAARRTYAAMITTTDHYIGRVLKALEAAKIMDNTIIVYMSDNGHSNETTYRIRGKEHPSGFPEGHFYGASGGGNTGPWIGHKSKFLEGGIRVPAILSYPSKIPSGEVRNQIVTAMDWYPTILELCNVKPTPSSPAIDGFSVLPICNSANAPSLYKDVLHFHWGSTWAVRDGNWKLMGADGNQKHQLVSLTDERPETINHAKDKPELVKRLLKSHQDWYSSVKPANPISSK